MVLTPAAPQSALKPRDAEVGAIILDILLLEVGKASEVNT